MSARRPARAKNLSLGGAVLAALAASSCCIGPLLVATLGVGGAGAFALLGAYRAYLLAGTAILLASGFYLSYRKPKSATAGDACGCMKPDRSAGRAGRIGLWTATVLVVLSAAAPQLLSLAGRRHGASVATTQGAPLEHATLRVEGMDCEACSVHLRAALSKVGGFHDMTLDLRAQTIDVAYEPAAGRLAAYVAAINELGYEASLPAHSCAPAR